MFNFWTVLYLLVVGLIAGFIARLVVKGRDPMPWWMTLLLGIIGSFVGGFAGYLLFGWDKEEGFFQPGGLIFSILGAIVVLLLLRLIRRRRSPNPSGGSSES
ncbi:GlsB/YeaQ/YmgE family stress response membrane protein [Microlunatus elymi]|uniref:GlsB/YeaQ/YmgE family stress response membrane protein n=1 Tax=Microlunatus elymi TaxID=2596828 RepID=A0A516PUS4_9ACTN|nr:GlsB/YeaQ/YmgE family stress response membrane protein [Microlunatus elymi]QDP94701.1 GlsB/YeaQ/YmgE family stress response membrane protein [Microlunatus elymi]